MLTHAKWFRSTDSEKQPLKTCLEWVHAQAEPFTVLSHEVPYAHNSAKCYRHYHAVDRVGLADWLATSKKFHAHEIILGPVKLFMDIEIVYASNPSLDCVGLLKEFLVCVADTAAQLFGASIAFLHLDASKAGVKFSRHIIGQMTTAEAIPVAFKSAADCGAFVRYCEALHGFAACLNGDALPLTDPQVYAPRHSLRTLGSCKLTDPGRPLVLVDADGQPASREKPPSVATFVETLVTARLGSAPSLTIIEFTTAVPVLGTKKVKRSGDSDVHYEASSEIAQMVHLIPPIVNSEIEKIKTTADLNFVYVTCRSQFCPNKGDDHKSSTVFFVIDTQSGTYKRKCHSTHCMDKASWMNLPPQALSVLRLVKPASTPLPPTEKSVFPSPTLRLPSQRRAVYSSKRSLDKLFK